MNKKRFLIFLLVFAMAIMPLFVTGCAKEGGDDGDYTEAEDDLPPSFDGTQKKYGGKKFKVLSHEDRQKNQAFNIVDLVPNEELGDEAVTVAVENRNEKIKKYFGVTIQRDTVPQAELESVANKNLKQMNDDYSVFRVRLEQALRLALTGQLLDLGDERWLDLTQPWWDSALTDSLLLYEGAYFGIGDICTVDDDATWVVLFNKDIYEESSKNKSEVLYELVMSGDGKAGGWTLDVLQSLAKEATREEEDQSKKVWDKNYTGGGIYGVTLQSAVSDALLVANNKTILKYDENDTFKVREEDANVLYNAVSLVYNFMNVNNYTDDWMHRAEEVEKATGIRDVYAEYLRPMFSNDRSLFFICHAGTIGLIREMETPFGILPMPKLEDSATQYGNTVQYSTADCYVIPDVGNSKNAEFAAYILEALAYYSSSEYDKDFGENVSLTYAYYETVLKRKTVRDNESVAMLELIFENRIFDVAIALKLKDVHSIIRKTMESHTNDFMSSFAGISDGNGIYRELVSRLENIINK